jgi:hypothetical protein
MKSFMRMPNTARVVLAVSVLMFMRGETFARGPGLRNESKEGNAANDRAARVALVTGNVFSGSETRDNLWILCYEIGGRLSGTEAGRKALDFAGDALRRYGLRNVHEEPFEFPGWFRGPFRCEVVSPERLVLHALALGNTPSTAAGGLEAEVIDGGHGNPVELDRLGESLGGKLVLVTDGPMPGGRWMHRSEVMLEVSKRGAAGLLFQTNEPGQLPMTGTCWMDGLSPLPGVGISKEDGDWMRGHLARGEKVDVRLEMTNEWRPCESANVVGEVAGEGDDFVIVGAHLDAWDVGQGAVDNGTGAAVVLEAARSVAQAARAMEEKSLRPRASIRFVLFMGEESGLYGSMAYAAAHEAELPHCRAMINCDMEGSPLGLRVMGHDEARPFFQSLLESLEAFEPSAGFSSRFGIHGDHQGFLLRGVPVVVPISHLDDESVRYYHTSADTYDKVKLASLSSDAAFVGAVALEIAWAKERPVGMLDQEAVKRFIRDNKLEEALKVYGHRL